LPLGLWRRLIAGSDLRKTRFHDELGRLVDPGVAFRNLPPASVTGALRLGFGLLPRRPWISYDAQRTIADFLGAKPRRVLEFGSGQSTCWYAQRARELVSIEDDPQWYANVAAEAAAFPGLDYRLARERADYSTPDVPGYFDLIMIDGRWRDDCARFALERLAPGGMIYLDNADKSATPDTGDIPQARERLMVHAAAVGWEMREFIDFAPAQMFVQCGLMVRDIANG
jgi:hypothetical protein